MKFTERTMKAWVWDEAVRNNVCPGTIFRWKKAGLYSHLTFRHVNRQVVFVSGPEREIIRPIQGRRYDWSQVDWSQGNSVIARQMRVQPSTVWHARRVLGSREGAKVAKG